MHSAKNWRGEEEEVGPLRATHQIDGCGVRVPKNYNNNTYLVTVHGWCSMLSRRARRHEFTLHEINTPAACSQQASRQSDRASNAGVIVSQVVGVNEELRQHRLTLTLNLRCQVVVSGGARVDGKQKPDYSCLR